MIYQYDELCAKSTWIQYFTHIPSRDLERADVLSLPLEPRSGKDIDHQVVKI